MGKPSKIQALAAQRRREQEKKQRETTTTREQASEPHKAGAAVAILDRLAPRKEDGGSQNAQSIYSSQSNLGKAHSSQPSQYKRLKLDRPTGDEVEARATDCLIDDESQSTDEIAPGQLHFQESTFTSALFPSFSTSSSFPDLPSYKLVLGPPYTDDDPFAGPSPDDKVLAAQSGSKQKTSKGPANDRNSKQNGVTKALASVKLDEPPKVKSRNLDVAAEFEKSNNRTSANFVVIGHVDHGKSTLMGRLLYDLKHPSLTQRDFSKLQKASSEAGKSSFALAWAMDSTEEERLRGVTIDIATNNFSTEKTDFTILDAPGHRDFIPNMIGGTSQADFAVLVVDASSDAFEAGLKGQTREHALLARSLGITKIVVAINKMDAAGWSKERFDEIQAQLSGFFAAAGFNQKNIIYVPCSGLTGENVVSPLTPDQQATASWYEGPSLVQALESSEPAHRRIHDALRLTVSDVFRNSAPGVPTGDVSLSGKIGSGNLQIGTSVLAQPATESGTVRGIEVNGEAREWAVAGQIVTLHLVGIEQEHLRSGDVICEKGKSPIQNVTGFTAKCLAFEHLLPGPVDCHRGRMHPSAKISRFLEIMGKEAASGNGGTNRGRKPRLVKPQQVVRLEVDLENDEKGLPLEPSDRVVLRQEGKTIAAGLIEDIRGFVSK